MIPGSHCNHNPLHDVIDEPHSPDLQAGADLSADEFGDRPDEIDVPINAGDLLIGDSRLLHATHANASDQRRTVLTLWYQTDLPSLPQKIQAQMVAKTQEIPADWDDETRARVQAIMPRYEGSAVAHERQLYRPKALRRCESREASHKMQSAGNPFEAATLLTPLGHLNKRVTPRPTRSAPLSYLLD